VAKQVIDKINKLFEIDKTKRKGKIIKLFMEFYKEFSENNDNMDFEITKEELLHL
jgi:hypothetical protein